MHAIGNRLCGEARYRTWGGRVGNIERLDNPVRPCAAIAPCASLEYVIRDALKAGNLDVAVLADINRR